MKLYVSIVAVFGKSDDAQRTTIDVATTRKLKRRQQKEIFLPQI